jgi:MtN3 and saliva related transmembrane protein
MAIIDILTTIVIVYGIIMNSSFWFQIHKIIKRKSSEDISLTTYFILIPGFIIWLIYGIVKNDLPLIISNILGMVTGITIIIVAIIYRVPSH